MRVRLEVIAMQGNEYVLHPDGDGLTFPHGELQEGEAPADAARRVVKAWTGTEAPKLELVDLHAAPGELVLVFRALLVEPAQGNVRKIPRMGLPEKVGDLAGRYVEEALKTSLAYKLTRG